MRYRTLSPSGDYVFGAGPAEFLVNSPNCVAQAVRTRLLLAEGEWYLDSTEGTPYAQEILGTGTQDLYDQAIRDRILGTEGVTAITAYLSYLSERRLTVIAAIDTLYGATQITQVF